MTSLGNRSGEGRDIGIDINSNHARIDPTSLEPPFQELGRKLKSTGSSRLKLLHIAEFVTKAHANPYFPAYSDNLADIFYHGAVESDLVGTNPDLLARFIECGNKIEEALPPGKKKDSCRSAMNRLLSEKARIEGWLLEKSSSFESNHRSHSSDAVWIPLVEESPGMGAPFALPRKLKARVAFQETGIENMIDTRDQIPERIVTKSLSVVRLFLRHFAGIDVRRGLTAHCSFQGFNKRVDITGESLEAGLALVLATAILRLFQYREEFAVLDDVAITGRLDEEGNLHTVDETGLKVKIEACLFSFIKYLVVPAEQESFCRTYCEELTSQFPACQDSLPLRIIGSRSLSYLFADRRLTHSHRVSAWMQVARKTWDKRKPVGIGVLIILLLLAGEMALGPLDLNPVKASMRGQVCIIENILGEELDRMVVGWSKGDFQSRITFEDVTGDGQNEIIWVDNSLDQLQLSEVFCRELRSDSLLWKIPLRRNFEFVNNPVQGGDYHSSNILAGDLDGDGMAETYVVAVHSGQYPSFLLKLDGKSGKELGLYLNAGTITTVVPWDLDGDGIKELIIGGISNAWRAGFLAVLDSRFIGGHAPVTEHYSVDNIEPACERFYMTFPPSVVSDSFPAEVPWLTVADIIISESDSLVRVSVREVTVSGKYSVTFHPSFTSDFRSFGIQTGDDFDLFVKSMLIQGRMSRVAAGDYMDDYVRRIRYWDGDRFLNEPVQNNRYLAKLRELEGKAALGPKASE